LNSTLNDRENRFGIAIIQYLTVFPILFMYRTKLFSMTYPRLYLAAGRLHSKRNALQTDFPSG
jgi:hypothetical protein